MLTRYGSYRDLVLIVFLLCGLNPSTGEELKLGVIAMRAGGIGWDQNSAAALIALNNLHKDGHMTNYTFRLIYMDSERSAKAAAGKAVQLKVNQSVNAFFGPPNSPNTVPVALLSSYWNMPHVSWASTDAELTDKKKYSTLIRLLGTFSKFAKSLLLVCEKFKWKKIAVFMNKNGICKYAREGMDRVFPKSGTDIVEQIIYEPSQINDDMIQENLLRVQQRARIIVICGRNTAEGRKIMIWAKRLGMTNGEYVYFYPRTHSTGVLAKQWEFTGEKDDGLNLEAREAYRSLFFISWREGPEEVAFRDNYARIFSEPPFNDSSLLNKTLSVYMSYVHDAFYCYGVIFQKILDAGGDVNNGTLFFEMSKNTTFDGKSGKVAFDNQGDREPDYWYWRFDEKNGEKYLALEVLFTHGNVPVIKEVGAIDWMNSRGEPPPDTPACGFFNENCIEDNTGMIIGIVVALFLAASAAGAIAFVIRKKKQEEELAKMLWKVNYGDIKLVNQKRGLGSQVSFISTRSGQSHSMKSSQLNGKAIQPPPGVEQNFTTVGLYKGHTVAVTRINKDALNLNKQDLIELKAMRDLGHENINPFVGACVDPPNYAVLFAYCTKGSLVDIIENDDIQLDSLFRRSLIQDLCNGLHFLHSSYLKSHGNLKSSNCVVDSRWMLKITDYGLQRLKMGQKEDDKGEYEKYSRLWWTAPELLRLTFPPPGGTQKGDVYGFGIIVYEISFRRPPFSTDTMAPKDIIDKVRNGEKECFRPETTNIPEDTNPVLLDLITSCWAENPSDRPETSSIKKSLKVINKGRNLNIMDNMLSMMEKYANNLEELVEQRTVELMEEKKKTDLLLYRMLPRQVAEKLKKGEVVKPEAFESVTIFFSDIVGFTTISARSQPLQVVDLLNALYTMFDGIIERHDVYKVETIGDAYMVVSGAPVRNGDLHAGHIADMALNILHGVLYFQIPHMPQVQLQVRIGLHTGSCCAGNLRDKDITCQFWEVIQKGVVGLSMPRYCLFGDTVNTASRMESNGKGLRIHLSAEANAALCRLGGYHTDMRGEINVKGKGKAVTYWLNGKDGFTKPLPTEKDINHPFGPDGLPQRYVKSETEA